MAIESRYSDTMQSHTGKDLFFTGLQKVKMVLMRIFYPLINLFNCSCYIYFDGFTQINTMCNVRRNITNHFIVLF